MSISQVRVGHFGHHLGFGCLRFSSGSGRVICKVLVGTWPIRPFDERSPCEYRARWDDLLPIQPDSLVEAPAPPVSSNFLRFRSAPLIRWIPGSRHEFAPLRYRHWARSDRIGVVEPPIADCLRQVPITTPRKPLRCPRTHSRHRGHGSARQIGTDAASVSTPLVGAHHRSSGP